MPNESGIKIFKIGLFQFDKWYYYDIMLFASDDRALVAQLDRAFGYGPKGWEFEPSLVH